VSSPEACSVLQIVPLGLDSSEGGAAKAVQLECQYLPFIIHDLQQPAKHCVMLERFPVLIRADELC